MADKIISFGIPCYNSQDYMDHCITSILEGAAYSDEIEIIIVDDGSRDRTAEKADSWAEKYPDIIRAIHQENGGHGIAVKRGMEEARGIYYKVVDSDDWLDADALQQLLVTLRKFVSSDNPVDLVISNYVYEHVEDNKQNVVDYVHALPQNQIMGWDDIGRFNITQYLLMHSLCYRTQVLRDGGLPMPAHTFYVDNIYAYVPLPRCKTLYYLNVDLYRYFIGRDDQSVNEDVLVSRCDHYWRVCKLMVHSYHLYDDIQSPKLRSYMLSYLTIIFGITSIISRMSDRADAMEQLDAVWDDLKDFDSHMYRHCRKGVVGVFANLPGKAGKKTTLGIYKLAQKFMKFN